jgi:hypothetical protein
MRSRGAWAALSLVCGVLRAYGAEENSRGYGAVGQLFMAIEFNDVTGLGNSNDVGLKDCSVGSLRIDVPTDFPILELSEFFPHDQSRITDYEKILSEYPSSLTFLVPYESRHRGAGGCYCGCRVNAGPNSWAAAGVLPYGNGHYPFRIVRAINDGIDRGTLFKTMVRNPSPLRIGTLGSRLCGVLSSADRGLHIVGLCGGGFPRQFNLALASVPESISRLAQREREPSDRDGSERGQNTAHLVKNLSDLDAEEWNDLIRGAVFLLGLFSYFAYFVITRDQREKPNDVHKPNS